MDYDQLETSGNVHGAALVINVIREIPLIIPVR